MRKLLCAAVCIVLLCPSARAAQRNGRVALTFDGCPAGIPELLERWGAVGTFMIAPGETVPEDLAHRGHELGLSLRGCATAGKSRRQVAAVLAEARAQLPEGCRPRWLAQAEGREDALEQVAKAMGLAHLGCAVDARQGLDDHLLGSIRPGDIIALGTATQPELEALLQLLRSRGLEAVTASRLAITQECHIRPGKTYEKFVKPHREAAWFPAEWICPRGKRM